MRAAGGVYPKGYARPLWIGGGITWEALRLIVEALDQVADKLPDGPLKTEICDVANAGYAEFTKRDDIRYDQGGLDPSPSSHVTPASSDLLAIGRRDSAPLGGG